MALGDTAPLIPIAHDWSADPERVRVVPTAVLPHDDGSEQRLALSHLATDRMTYRLLAPETRDASILITLADLATDTLVRVPRWEDQTRVDAVVSAGSAVVIPCDTTDKPTFAEGRQIILWRSARQYEVTTCDTLADDAITADLASEWGAGTIIAPVMPGRLVLPLALSHWVPTTGALECVIDFSLADIAGVGTGGDGAAGVPAAITNTGAIVYKFGRTPAYAVVTDAAGNVLRGQPIVWTSSDPTNAPVHATPNADVAIVGNPNGLNDNSGTRTVTATLGGLSASHAVFLVG